MFPIRWVVLASIAGATYIGVQLASNGEYITAGAVALAIVGVAQATVEK